MLRSCFFAVAALATIACEPLATNWVGEEVFPIDVAKTIEAGEENPQRLKVMTWNVKFGGGRINFYWDYWGERVHMDAAEVEANMEGINALIRQTDIDILLAQEVDRNSKRAAYVDQVQQILDNTQMNYAAFVPVWKVRFLASEGYGRVESGIVIFSRYPIESNTRIALPDRGDQDAITRYFYLHRALNEAVIDLGNKKVTVLNVHLVAYANDDGVTKGLQLGQTHDRAKAATHPMLVGGDFNSLPPQTERIADFGDDGPFMPEETDFDGDTYDLAEMDLFYNDPDLQPALQLSDYGETEVDQKGHFTHTVADPVQAPESFWNRKLDYLFVDSGSIVAGSTHTLQKPGDGNPALPADLDPMLLSDHCPVVTTWELP